MSTTVEVKPGVHVPLKCTDHNAAGVPRSDCTVPGSQLKCRLCPASQNYWRRKSKGVAA